MSPEAKRVAGLVDLTLLNLSAEPEALYELGRQGELAQVAAFCIYPKHLPLLNAPNTIRRATVLNFPAGTDSIDDTHKALHHIIHHNLAQEIDYVFPYTRYLAGETTQALADATSIIQACHTHHLTIKIILETESFPDDDTLFTLCLKLIEQGCDFLKTSTGTKPIGATPEAVKTILEAIQHSEQSTCGLKVSGGVKTLESALFYMELAEKTLGREVNANGFRLGASSLVSQLLKT